MSVFDTRRSLSAVLALAAAFSGGNAGAATFRVDDTASAPQESVARLHWRQLSPARQVDNTLEGVIAVTIRLNLAPWLNKAGRLYLVLPEQPIGTVRASWTSQGRLLSGQIVSGQRTLVYSGPVTSPLLDETLALKIEADGDRLGSPHKLKFHFEIDVD